MLIRIALIVGLGAVMALPVMAQEMPAWAAPETITPPPPRTSLTGPDLPPDPNPVPLNGAALLALAGLGYAVRRLRR